MRSALSVVALCLCAIQTVSAQGTCKLEGVWQLVSGADDGKPYPAGTRMIKIITKRHFAFLVQQPGGPKELKTVADSAAAFRTGFSGGGTYTLQGTTYTEKIEYFGDPIYVGKSVAFNCRMEGDRFYQSGVWAVFQAGKKVRDSKLEEVWRRVE